MSQLTTSLQTSGDVALSCPSCGAPIDVEQAIERQADEKLRHEYNQKFARLKKELQAQTDKLERERLEVKQLSAQTWEIIQAELKNERIKLAEKLKAEAAEQARLKVEQLTHSLEEQRVENTRLKRQELDLLSREQKLQHQQEQSRLELERQLLSRVRVAEQEIRDQFQSQQELLKVEYEKRLSDQKKLLVEMNRKIEQGSVQMQGEVQEMVIEQYLNQTFSHDRIDAIKAGARGGDCLHTVMTDQMIPCGTIYYESKRTKAFQHSWIEKLKADVRLHKADIGVLITQTMPRDIPQMGLLEGVWVCSFDAFRALIPVLRYHLLALGESKMYQEESGEKMHVLYRFLTSNEFKQQIEGIVEGFTQLHDELQKEKRAMQSIWKRREKQIDKVLLNTNHMYSSIRGIAGREVPSIAQLELSMLDEKIDSE